MEFEAYIFDTKKLESNTILIHFKSLQNNHCINVFKCIRLTGVNDDVSVRANVVWGSTFTVKSVIPICGSVN